MQNNDALRNSHNTLPRNQYVSPTLTPQKHYDRHNRMHRHISPLSAYLDVHFRDLFCQKTLSHFYSIDRSSANMLFPRRVNNRAYTTRIWQMTMLLVGNQIELREQNAF